MIVDRPGKQLNEGAEQLKRIQNYREQGGKMTSRHWWVPNE